MIPRLPRCTAAASIAALALLALQPATATAVLDINDRGPTLDAGSFRMRITNAGIIGNAFFDKGLSNDPSFEFPANSGNECLNHASLWVGALDANGIKRVSGGPELEWRPTLADDDHVRLVSQGALGTRRGFDDDGDGRVDEEILNGKDDDGDGEVDEDLALFSQQLAAADYVDDRPEAIYYGYPTGETHVPLNLSVHQEAYAWTMPGFSSIAGLQFTITNHGTQVLHQVYVGVLADLDSRKVTDRAGHRNDMIETHTYSQTFNNGRSNITLNGINTSSCGLPSTCVSTMQQTLPVLTDGNPASGLPVVAVIGLDHTTDPLSFITPVKAYARAPGKTSFRYAVYSNSRTPGQGGLPAVDETRYDAMVGLVDDSPTDVADDYEVLVSCGPFPALGPGQTILFAAALVAGQNLDSLKIAIQNAMIAQHGVTVNQLPDSTGPGTTEWNVGRSGLNGHEVCLSAPGSVEFDWDPHCAGKFAACLDGPPESPTEHYTSTKCIWTDADCDPCTGVGGRETVARWLDPGEVPPPPAYALTPGDHRVTIAWNNLPEVLLKGGVVGTKETQFVGYRVWRLADWTRRQSLLPPQETWALMGTYGFDTGNSGFLLSSFTDSSLDYDRILYEQKLYPVGRYVVTDTTTLDGFDYEYVVTSVYNLAQRNSAGYLFVRQLESPITTTFNQRVAPRAAAKSTSAGIWVVPNPFRAHADWDLPVVPSDPLPRHLDFMGLPRALSTIKIWTVAGDFVAQIIHDGRSGDGEAKWDLVSRNGQDVESGIYLFTVDSSIGHAVGKFVVIR